MRRKVLLVAILILAILLQCLMPFTRVNAASGVEITLNSKLYNAVKSQLEDQGISASFSDANRTITISQSDLDRVTSLNLSNKEIDDLAGLEAFTNLTYLNLHANELTVDSNLSVIDSFNSLKDLDLSSNKLESIKSITSFHNIEKADITNQKVVGQQVISIDTSDEAQEHPTTIEVDLPDIIFEDETGIEPEWITKTITKAKDSTEPAPDIGFVQAEDGSIKLSLDVASETDDGYKVKRGLIRIEINVKNSTSKIKNTQIIYNYIIVDESETGILFKDENLYKAVKEQLTRGQTKNTEITETSSRDLYVSAYDEALILVIKKDDINNNIPSLILHDKMIEDLTGIEEFVGLKSKLDVSYNYIDTIEKIIDLENNKKSKEVEIRNKFQKILNALKDNLGLYDENTKIAKENNDKADQAKDELNAMEFDDPNRESKAHEIEGYLNAANDAEKDAEKYKSLILKYVKRLYEIYNDEYRLVTLLPVEVYDLSYEDLMKVDLEKIKGYMSSIMNKITALEDSESLTIYENWAIQKLLTEWGKLYELEFQTQKDVASVDPETGEESTVKVDIEKPIKEFFDVINKDETLDLNAYKKFIYMFKAIDTLSQIENYSTIQRTCGTDGDKTTRDYAIQALAEIKEVLKAEDIDAYFYEKVKEVDKAGNDTFIDVQDNSESKIHLFENAAGIFKDVKIGLGDKEYKGEIEVDVDAKILLAHKFCLIDDSYLERFIYLPRIQELDLEDNNIGSLAGLEQLQQLKSLNANKNNVNKVDNVDWKQFSKLQELYLSFNQISDIEPLEVLKELRKLDVSNNLLAGRFTFSLINMKKITDANFSHNQYDDISYASNQFMLKAMAAGKTAIQYLKDSNLNLNFQYQELEIEVTVTNTGDKFIDVDLPLIFSQVEKFDNENTSFGYSSKDGVVDAKGEKVRLQLPTTDGKYEGSVTIQGRNGFTDVESQKGIGYGTSCKITYTVTGSANVPVKPDDPTTPTDPSVSGKPEKYGYEIKGEYVLVNKPETTVADFTNEIVDTTKYDVKITDNNSNNISTGAVVTISNKSTNEVYDVFEVVVKGDTNGDSVVNALDSGLVKQYINDTINLVGSYESAADVNYDGKVNSLDSMLILQYRAEILSQFGN